MLDYKKLKALTLTLVKSSLYTYKEFENLLNLSFFTRKRFKQDDTKRYEWPVYDWHTDKNVGLFQQ